MVTISLGNVTMLRPIHVLQQKNFEDNKISVLKWPANSPDMSPIELAWKLLKDIVYQKKIFTSVAELWSEVQKSVVIFNSTKRQTMKKKY